MKKKEEKIKNTVTLIFFFSLLLLKFSRVKEIRNKSMVKSLKIEETLQYLRKRKKRKENEKQ